MATTSARSRNPTVTTTDIKRHYDSLSSLYRLLWGPHIHHGYWEDGETPELAQEKLVERLAERAAVQPGDRVLDIGCGLGGSSLWLAKNRGCSVVGVTLSDVQVAIATKESIAQSVESQTRFLVMDANHLSLDPSSFDVAWAIESSEHLFDKATFLRQCSSLLAPGGRLALCSWLAGPNARHDRALLSDIAERMLCPSFSSLNEIKDWIDQSGLTIDYSEDITRRVESTWDLASAIAKRPEIKALLLILDKNTRRFVESFELMQRAYATGVMSYGMIVARKSSG